MTLPRTYTCQSRQEAVGPNVKDKIIKRLGNKVGKEMFDPKVQKGFLPKDMDTLAMSDFCVFAHIDDQFYTIAFIAIREQDQ